MDHLLIKVLGFSSSQLNVCPCLAFVPIGMLLEIFVCIVLPRKAPKYEEIRNTKQAVEVVNSSCSSIPQVVWAGS